MWIINYFDESTGRVEHRAESVYTQEVLDQKTAWAILQGLTVRSVFIPEHEARFLPNPDYVYQKLLDDPL